MDLSLIISLHLFNSIDMKLLHFYFFFGLVSVLPGFAQIGNAQPSPVIWQRLLDKNSALPAHFHQLDANVMDAEPTTDGGVVIAVAGTQPYIVRIDGAGMMKWAKSYEFGAPIRQISETADGDFIGVGAGNDANGFFFMVAEIDPNGILKSFRRIPLLLQNDVQSQTFLPQLLPTPDGGFLLGSSDHLFTMTGPDNSRLYTIKVQLLKISRDGQTQWQKVVGGSTPTQQTYLQGLMRDENDNLLVSLFTNSQEILNFDPGTKLHPFGLLLNEQGNIIQNNVKAPGAAQRTTIGNYVEMKPVVTTPLMFTINWYDPNLTLLTSTMFTNSFYQFSGYWSALQPTPDGGVLVGDPLIDPNFKADFRLSKFSAKMKLEWQQVGGGSGDDIIQSIKLASDGNYLIIGRTNSADNAFFGANNNPNGVTIWVRKQVAAPTPGGGEFTACYEAENAAGTGGTYDDPNASGGKARGQYGNSSEHLIYTLTGIPAAGTYVLSIRFRNGEEPSAGVIVNGGAIQTIGLPRTGGNYGEVSLNVTLNAGTNTIRIQGGSGGAFNQDKICITQEVGQSARMGSLAPVITSEPDALELAVFPNPAAGKVNVRFYGPENSKSILRVTDLTGRLLAERQMTGRGEVQEETVVLPPSNNNTVLITLQRGKHRITKTLIINQ